MNLCLNQQCSTTTSSFSAARRKDEKYDPIYRNKTPLSLPLPKSHPTPLLIQRRLPPRSKKHALENIISELEFSAKSGIELNDPQIFCKLLRKNVGIASKLLRLYACSGQLEKAHEVFDGMSDQNSSAFQWNSLISGYAKMGQYEDALALFFQMVEDGVRPDQYTFPRVLKACGGVGMVQIGEEVHRWVVRSGFGNNTFVLNALVDMYPKCGDIITARKVFDGIKGKDLVSCNSMINGYVRHGLIIEALSLLRRMVVEGLIIEALSLLRRMVVEGSEPDGVTLSAVVQNDLEKATWLFECMPERDVVSWNSIISAHSKDPVALKYFDRMLECDASPDGITFVSLLSACAHSGMVRDGERLFRMMVEKCEMSRAWSITFMKAGCYEDAERVRGVMMERGLDL
ncbi:UMP/CMP kinase [Salvia divinorum]|uniref:UMP/CMP kinase n=1 Tax=Salvia divinorum TaxID=28513 RepID=A0ABD1FHM8_SALDI